MEDHATLRSTSDEFIVQLASCQNRLYAYVLSLLPDADLARDVVQEANLVMWRKATDFTPGTSFEAWACKIAYFEVLAARRKRRQDRLLFSEELMEQLMRQLSVNAERRAESFSAKQAALEECMGRLDSAGRQQLLARYSPGGSVKAVAKSLGVSPAAAAALLYRVRKSLLACIEFKIAQEAAS
jgi:RNA polymerase sigma-70 factor (ECF subfamily)